MRPHIHKLEYLVETLQSSVWYALLIAFLAIVSLFLLAYEFFPWANLDIIPITQRLDLAIAWIFLTDFFIGLLLNKSMSKRQYWRENWLNLVSSIPVTNDAVRILRILRILRAFRIIRAATNFWFAQARLRRNHAHLNKKTT